MTFTGGEHVRLKTGEMFRDIGIVVGINGDDIEVEYRSRYASRYASDKTVKHHYVNDLEEMCKQTVFRDYSSRECGRPAKEDHLCGMHLGHLKRRETERLKRESDQRAREERTARRIEKQGELLRVINREGLGGIVKIYDTDKGLVTIKLDDLINLLE